MSVVGSFLSGPRNKVRLICGNSRMEDANYECWFYNCRTGGIFMSVDVVVRFFHAYLSSGSSVLLYYTTNSCLNAACMLEAAHSRCSGIFYLHT